MFYSSMMKRRNSKQIRKYELKKGILVELKVLLPVFKANNMSASLLHGLLTAITTYIPTAFL